MIPLIEHHLAEIRELCRTYRIVRLDLFGSAAKGTWNPETSDVDFLVDLGDYDDDVLNRYFGLANALEALLGRDVDLVTDEELQNPYFIASVRKSKVNLYETWHLVTSGIGPSQSLAGQLV